MPKLRATLIAHRAALLRGAALALCLLPLAWVLLGSGAAVSEALSHGRPFLDGQETRLWWRSLGIAALAAGFALGAGVPYGWWWGRAVASPGWLWTLGALVPLLLPSYALVVAALYLLERAGIGAMTPAWSGLALELPGLMVTAAAVLAAGYWPVVAWFTAWAARSVPPELEDAARLEAPDGLAAWFAAAPYLRPATLAALLFVFLTGFASYSVGDSLGLPTYAREILMRFKADLSAATAARLGIGALVIALPLVILQRGWLARVPLAPADAARPPNQSLPNVRGAGRIARLFGALVAVVTTGLPVLALALHAGEQHGLARALQNGGEALLQSGWLALAAASLAIGLALLAGSPFRRPGEPAGARALLDLAATLPYALPGALLAVGIVVLLNRPGPLGALYGTTAALLWAYALLFLPYAYWSIAPAWQRVDAALYDDALLLGAGGWSRWRHVCWPALRGPVLLAGALVFALAIREMEATVVLKPPGLYPLAYAIWDVLHFGSREEAAGLCLLLASGTGLVAGALVALALREP